MAAIVVALLAVVVVSMGHQALSHLPLNAQQQAVADIFKCIWSGST